VTVFAVLVAIVMGRAVLQQRVVVGRAVLVDFVAGDVGQHVTEDFVDPPSQVGRHPFGLLSTHTSCRGATMDAWPPRTR